jgi:peptidoglycan/LPS O-acetylase OafA/YrhL
MSMGKSLRADVQGLRGIAVLLVVLYHCNGLLGSGFIGVDVFFVISGFVITRMLISRYNESGTFSLVDFYRRRILRILPAAGLTIAVVGVAAVLLQSPNGDQQSTSKVGLGSAIMLANFVIPRELGGYFAPAAENHPLLHMWSLGVEEQFYVLLPLLLVVAGFWRQRQGCALRRARVGLMTIGVASLGLCIGWSYGWLPGSFGLSGPDSAFYLMPARAWEFATGALLAFRPEHRSPKPSHSWVRLSGLVVILASAVAIPASLAFPGVVAPLPVIGTVAIIASGPTLGASQVDRVNRLFIESRLLGWVGDRSYAWYLWHWPTIVFARVVVSDASTLTLVIAAVGSLGLAALSYRLVENPIRFSPRARRKAFSLVAVTAVGFPLIVSGGLGFGAERGWGQDWALGAHAIKRRDCDSGRFDPDRCTWNAEARSGHIVLVGDSQAWALGDALVDIAKSTDRRLLALVLNGCPFLDPELQDTGAFVGSACREREASIVRYLEDVGVSTVVIANNSPGYVGQDVSKAEVWSTALGSVVEQVMGMGHDVAVVLPPPAGDSDSGRGGLLLRPSRPRSTLASETLESRRVAVGADLAAVSSQGVGVLDPAEVLCDEKSCTTATADHELYVDGNHLSVNGARLLIDDLRSLLKP